MNIVKLAKATIQKHNLIQYGDRVIVGISGGADSVALLFILNSLKQELGLQLVGCHVNHKIRNETAERDQKFVEQLCANLNIECYVKEAFVEDLAKEWHMSVEEAGRKVRYDFFNEVANGDKIATAHHKNDNVETVVMRFMRGTGLQGLTGIPYKRGNIVRPLLDISRKEVEDYLAAMNQEYMTDETNLEAVYTRNKIRLNLIPEIIQEFNPNFLDTLHKNVQNYQEDNDCLLELAEHFYHENCLVSNNGMSVNLKNLTQQPKAIAKRVVLKMVQEVTKKEISSALLENLMNLLSKEVGSSVKIHDEYMARISYNQLIVENIVQENQDLTKIPVVLNSVMKVGNMQIRVTEVVQQEPIVNNAHTFYLPRNLFKSEMCFRTRHSGDVLHIAHNISKKVNRYFTDVKIAENLRNKYWMLTDGLWTVYWIPELFGGRFQKRIGNFIKFEIIRKDDCEK